MRVCLYVYVCARISECVLLHRILFFPYVPTYKIGVPTHINSYEPGHRIPYKIAFVCLGIRIGWSECAVRLKMGWILGNPQNAKRRLIRLRVCGGWSMTALGGHMLLKEPLWSGLYMYSRLLFSKSRRHYPLNCNSQQFRLLCHLSVILKVSFANSVDPDQTAPLGAVWSGSTLFACMKKNRFERFAKIFSRRHKQTTFSDVGFLGVLRVTP